ncbi:protein of unknown function [Paenibacillus polysaccharolyticus]|uniref:DUF4062 domain-containing protein n=1 Tax=Paenibacillus polysaccharolyticus TaxID=582692 RepID=A0A1G5AUX1_9BACL|nr:DUF4062 domain-containing protein [Paenibacillus polysaccharolyticus]SCX81641.1 protein of unknown function [Paenibacillus polysaccharolyticus]
MIDKKYQVFISSTYSDLVNARKTTFDTILSLYHFPVGMEMFGSDDDEQWKFIEKTIRDSDYYLLIVGHRYGSLSHEGISYTEKEFDFAKEQGIPIIAFVRDRDMPTSPKERDRDISLVEKLDKFIDKVQTGRLVSYWDTEDKLAAEIAKSLPKTMVNHPRTGWVRADKVLSSESVQELFNLSTENRKLREELEGLRKLNSNLPEIKLLLNNFNSLNFTLKNPILNNEVKIINMQEIENRLKPYVIESEIIEYNTFIGLNTETVDRYNKELRRSKHIELNKQNLNFTVHNVGKSLANNIYVDIEFPNEILILEIDYEHREPRSIAGLPENPLISMEQKANNALYGNDALSLMKRYNVTSLLEFNNNKNYNVLLKPARFNTETWSKLSNQKLTLRLNSLTHTRRTSFDDEYVIIPLKKGTFEIIATIICNEYAEPTTIVIPVNVN